LAAAVALRPRGGAVAGVQLRFGLTPVFLDSDLELLQRLEAYLTAALDRPVELVRRRTYQEITLLLRSGQLDAAWICGFPFIRYEAELALVAVPLWRGKPLYRSYLLSRAERPAISLAELRGDIHAFSDPDSNSGWLVTVAALAERRERPQDFFRHSFFTYGHRNVIRAVASGLADSGSVDGYVFEVLAQREPELCAGAVVVERSVELGFPPIATRRESAGSEPIRALAAALDRMPGDLLGREILDVMMLDGFVAGSRQLFTGIAERYDRVGRLA
jgi:phosphonate transport system substrate-binding protein